MIVKPTPHGTLEQQDAWNGIVNYLAHHIRLDMDRIERNLTGAYITNPGLNLRGTGFHGYVKQSMTRMKMLEELFEIAANK